MRYDLLKTALLVMQTLFLGNVMINDLSAQNAPIEDSVKLGIDQAPEVHLWQEDAAVYLDEKLLQSRTNNLISAYDFLEFVKGQIANNKVFVRFHRNEFEIHALERHKYLKKITLRTVKITDELGSDVQMRNKVICLNE